MFVASVVIYNKYFEKGLFIIFKINQKSKKYKTCCYKGLYTRIFQIHEKIILHLEHNASANRLKQNYTYLNIIFSLSSSLKIKQRHPLSHEN